MTAVNRIGMDSTPVDVSPAAFWRAADPSPFDGSFISSWRDHHSHEYNPFRFAETHHPYDPASAYYHHHPETAMDVYASSTSNAYPSYMVHHVSSPPSSSSNGGATGTSVHDNLSSIKPETSAAAVAFQSAFSLSNPMNVNVSMNFNSHNVQYNPAYGSNTTSSPYESFYNSTPTSHYPFVHHSPDLKNNHRLSSDPVSSKQAMFLSTANYDYKDLSKLCDFFPTPSSSSSSSSAAAAMGVGASSMNANDKRNPWSTGKTSSSSSSSQIKSNEGRINRCRICGKIYARPSTLKTHLRTHSGEKPYKCDKCSKAFTQAANLTAHLRTHSGEKPFACDICGRKFSQSSSVTTHMRTHSGERPYQCKYCRKAFSDSSTLTKHMRVHSGEKPYECSLCRLRFSQSGNLNRHMRIHINGGANAHLHHSK